MNFEKTKGQSILLMMQRKVRSSLHRRENGARLCSQSLEIMREAIREVTVS
jgi:hypothetical protein